MTDYEPVTRRGRRAGRLAANEWPASDAGGAAEGAGRLADAGDAGTRARLTAAPKKGDAPAALRRGHSLTYFCLFLFTVLLYLRPSEIYPSAVTNNIAFVVGLLTLAVYLPSQLAVEGTLSARPREVNAVLLLAAAALLSMPLADSPSLAWETFGGTFIRCVVIFVVIVNAVRTERRLRGLLLLAVLVSCWLSAGAINAYMSGNLTVEG